MSYRHPEKTVVKVPTRPRRVDIAVTRYNATIGMTRGIVERIISRNKAMRKMVRSEQ
jgi:hypothetical protein